MYLKSVSANFWPSKSWGKWSRIWLYDNDGYTYEIMTENERNKTLPHKSMDRHTLTYNMRHHLIQSRDNRNALYATHLLNVFLWLYGGSPTFKSEVWSLHKMAAIWLLLACFYMNAVLPGVRGKTDYYEVLGVTRSASNKDIKDSYKKLVKEWWVFYME